VHLSVGLAGEFLWVEGGCNFFVVISCVVDSPCDFVDSAECSLFIVHLFSGLAGVFL
jgi:hypothetical protein